MAADPQRRSTVMGRLRSVLHGLALDGADPAEALTKLDAYLRTLDADRFATCLDAIHQPGNRRRHHAASGHLPPPLVSRERTTYLEVPPALPLGLGSSPAEREVDVPPGAGLLLYTDGLVEHGRQPLETGLTALQQACALPTTPRTHPQQLVEQALILLGKHGPVEDDTALLAATTEPGDLSYSPDGALTD